MKTKYYIKDVSKEAGKPCFEIRKMLTNQYVAYSITFDDAKAYIEGTLNGELYFKL